jgi:hypothetical protein
MVKQDKHLVLAYMQPNRLSNILPSRLRNADRARFVPPVQILGKQRNDPFSQWGWANRRATGCGLEREKRILKL